MAHLKDRATTRQHRGKIFSRVDVFAARNRPPEVDSFRRERPEKIKKTSRSQRKPSRLNFFEMRRCEEWAGCDAAGITRRAGRFYPKRLPRFGLAALSTISQSPDVALQTFRNYVF